jgi:AcrR family transcriptional regulator
MNTPTTRTERKKEETRQKVIAVALDLFHQHGIEAVSMEQIAAAADIAKGTLYHYFPVKEAIIAGYIQRVSIERNAERIDRLRDLPGTRERMALSLTELMRGVEAQKELFERYFIYRIQQMISLERNAPQEKGLYSLESEIIRLGQAEGEIRTDLPGEFLEALFEFTFIILAQRYYRDPSTFQAEKNIFQCVELFMNGAAIPIQGEKPA